MLIRSGPESTAVATAGATADPRTATRHMLGLLAVSVYPQSGDHPAETFVADPCAPATSIVWQPEQRSLKSRAPFWIRAEAL